MRRLRSLGRTLRLDGDTPGREAGLRDRESRQPVRLHFVPARLARTLGEGRRDRDCSSPNGKCLDLTLFPFPHPPPTGSDCGRCGYALKQREGKRGRRTCFMSVFCRDDASNLSERGISNDQASSRLDGKCGASGSDVASAVAIYRKNQINDGECACSALEPRRDSVYDPFAGCGTIALEAIQRSR
jgi:hypothetical protein